MLSLVKRLWTEEEGQGMAEYGLILALIAVVCVVALNTLGGGLKQKLLDVNSSLAPSSTTTTP